MVAFRKRSRGSHLQSMAAPVVDIEDPVGARGTDIVGVGNATQPGRGTPVAGVRSRYRHPTRPWLGGYRRSGAERVLARIRRPVARRGIELPGWIAPYGRRASLLVAPAVGAAESAATMATISRACSRVSLIPWALPAWAQHSSIANSTRS